ncbi:MAG TPA: hypothetical protein VEC36_03255 [Patescibacteria group bacterium]|nr:hypothetical protein [Patescibacteria group bacterium]
MISISILVSSCRNDEQTQLPECKELSFKPVFLTGYGDSGLKSFGHYLMLETYDEHCFNRYDFVFLADKYLDTLQTNVPVQAIMFVKPFKFNPGSEWSVNEGELQRNAIVEIWYESKWVDKSVTIPKINNVTIWFDGKRRTLYVSDTSSRSSRIKQFKNKR